MKDRVSKLSQFSYFANSRRRAWLRAQLRNNHANPSPAKIQFVGRLTVASPVRGVSFLVAAIVTGGAVVMIVVVTLNREGRNFSWEFLFVGEGQKF